MPDSCVRGDVSSPGKGPELLPRERAHRATSIVVVPALGHIGFVTTIGDLLAGGGLVAFRIGGAGLLCLIAAVLVQSQVGVDGLVAGRLDLAATTLEAEL
jgi:hypothetical protein